MDGKQLKIAVFGQAAFGREVTERVAECGHEIVGVYAPPAGKRPDPLAELAEEKGWPLFRHKAFRKKGEAIPETWALDRNGNPTTDADAALQGSMLPIGGAKGRVPALAGAGRGTAIAALPKCGRQLACGHVDHAKVAVGPRKGRRPQAGVCSGGAPHGAHSQRH